MINIEQVYDNVVKITDEDYRCDKIKIMEHLFNVFNIIILDYEIRLMEKDSFLGQYMDIYPHSLDEDFISILKKFNEMENDSDEELKYSIKILAIMERKNLEEMC